MRYQFTLHSPPRRSHVVVFVALVAAIVAGYIFAACGDRTPREAAARQPETSSVVAPESAGTRIDPVVTGPVTFEQADAAFRDARYGDAVNLFNAYTERRPENPWGFYMLGLSSWRAGERDEAIAAFTKALELDSMHVKSHLNLSRVLIEVGRPEEAVGHVKHALALDSTSGDGLRLLGRAREALGC